jgi:hypothetical protein
VERVIAIGSEAIRSHACDTGLLPAAREGASAGASHRIRPDGLVSISELGSRGGAPPERALALRPFSGRLGDFQV